jgi:hypothetical protein
MDKLERYLDQVCRSISGSRSLRQHIRQELREHLRDAIAGHRAAGMSEEEALDRALEDFGGPEQVKSELEATHGSRLMPLVIDKAMQWKEKTMKAKWLWTSWAYLALVGVVALEVAWISFATMFLVPRFQVLMRDGLLDSGALRESQVSWMPALLNDVAAAAGYTTWILLGVAVAWGLFEWTVRSDNKPFMRLSALGTAAVGLMVVAILQAASLSIPFMLAMPPLATRSFAMDQLTAIDTSVAKLEQAMAKKDWEAVQDNAALASYAADNLAKLGVAARVLASRQEVRDQTTVDELRGQINSASECLHEAQQAIRDRDADRLSAVMQRFNRAYGPVRETAKKSVN